jgi:hypothetical protein
MSKGNWLLCAVLNVVVLIELAIMRDAHSLIHYTRFNEHMLSFGNNHKKSHIFTRQICTKILFTFHTFI